MLTSSTPSSLPRLPRFFAIGVLGLSLLLLIPASLYVVSSAMVIHAAPHLEAITLGQPPEPVVIADDIQAYTRAVAIFPDTRFLSDLALLQLSLARHSSQPSWADAEQALSTSLQYRPLDPLSWARLAYVKTQQGERVSAVSALLHSLTYGRYIPGFMQWRYVLGLGLWADLDQTTRDQLGDQSGLLWRKKKWNLIRLGRLAPFSEPIGVLLQTYQPDYYDEFLRRRGSLRHTP